MKPNEKPAAYVARLGGILLVLTVVVAALLGGVNYITKGPIAESNRKKTENAMAEVLKAENYTAVDRFTDDTGLVTGVWRADDLGYVVECVTAGSQGDIDLIVGVSADGAVKGVSIISMSETSGLGANAAKAEWRSQFEGQSGTVEVTKDGGTIEALTGATITSRAVCRAVSAASACAAALG